MKRGWIGAGLLAGLLILGLLVTWFMGRTHTGISEELELSARFAIAGNWEEAEELAEEAYEDWQDSWHFSAAFADHEPMEEIDALFAQLLPYLLNQDAVSFSAVCRELARQVEAIGDAHNLNWWNLL